MRQCPDCSQLMAEQAYGETVLDVCTHCAGIWFDDGELRRAMQTDALAFVRIEDEHVPSLSSVAPPARLRRCPECECVLERYQYLYDSPVQLDMCGTCGGVWVEDGELRKMHEWLHGTGLTEGAPARKWTPDQERRLALAIAAHEREKGRMRLLFGLFTAVGRMGF